MLDIKVVSVNSFSNPEKSRGWVMPIPSLLFYVRGLRWRRDVYGLRRSFSPSLVLRPANYHSEYEYGPDRENWAVLFEKPEIQETDTPDFVSVRVNNEFLRLPRETPVPEVRLPHFQNVFRELTVAACDPSLVGRLRVQAKLTSVFEYILEQHLGNQASSPAGRLKKLLEEDDNWQRSLTAMCCECGFNPDYLRRLFVEEFGLPPHQYRCRRRIAMVTQLLAESDLSIKQIAGAVGFRYVSHLALAYRRASGRTPAQARREIRG